MAYATVGECPTANSAKCRYVDGPWRRRMSSELQACARKKWTTPDFRKPAQHQAPYPRLKRGTLDVAQPRRLFFGRSPRAMTGCIRVKQISARRRSRPALGITISRRRGRYKAQQPQSVTIIAAALRRLREFSRPPHHRHDGDRPYDIPTTLLIPCSGSGRARRRITICLCLASTYRSTAA